MYINDQNTVQPFVFGTRTHPLESVWDICRNQRGTHFFGRSTRTFERPPPSSRASASQHHRQLTQSATKSEKGPTRPCAFLQPPAGNAIKNYTQGRRATNASSFFLSYCSSHRNRKTKKDSQNSAEPGLIRVTNTVPPWKACSGRSRAHHPFLTLFQNYLHSFFGR